MRTFAEYLLEESPSAAYSIWQWDGTPFQMDVRLKRRNHSWKTVSDDGNPKGDEGKQPYAKVVYQGGDDAIQLIGPGWDTRRAFPSHAYTDPEPIQMSISLHANNGGYISHNPFISAAEKAEFHAAKVCLIDPLNTLRNGYC